MSRYPRGNNRYRIGLRRATGGVLAKLGANFALEGADGVRPGRYFMGGGGSGMPRGYAVLTRPEAGALVSGAASPSMQGMGSARGRTPRHGRAQATS